MKNLKTYKVVIGHIWCSLRSYECRGFYNFDWWLYENGKLKNYGNYDGSFTNPKYIKPRGAEAFRQLLKRGYAHQIVLQNNY